MTSFSKTGKNFVEPEICDLFLSAREIVLGDLAALPTSGLPPSASGAEQGYGELFDPVAFVPTEHSLTIPAAHMEAWLRVLNQARLVIATRRGFDEKSMERERPFPAVQRAARARHVQDQFLRRHPAIAHAGDGLRMIER